jgi:hypothetical protein
VRATSKHVETGVSPVRGQRLHPLEALTGADPKRKRSFRKVRLEQDATIRALAETKSLRSWTTDFGISHETIRAVLRQVSAV